MNLCLKLAVSVARCRSRNWNINRGRDFMLSSPVPLSAE